MRRRPLLDALFLDRDGTLIAERGFLSDPKGVRLAPGADLAHADLGAWCHERLATYKVPVRYVVVDDFPRTGTDKIQRRLVAEQLAAG